MDGDDVRKNIVELRQKMEKSREINVEEYKKQLF